MKKVYVFHTKNQGWLPLQFESNNKARERAEFINSSLKGTENEALKVVKIVDASTNKTIFKERIIKY